MFLIDTIDHFISGDWGEESQTPESPRATYCIRGADINNVNSHNFGGTPLRYVNQSSFDNKQLQAGDIIIEEVQHNRQAELLSFLNNVLTNCRT